MRSVIVSAARTPFGKLGGGLASHQAPELGAIAIKAALERAGLEPNEVEYVIMGEVLQAGVGQAPARQAAIGAGIPKELGSDTINKVCASSIRAVEIADVMIRAGDHDVIVTGGMESMSNAPYILTQARFGYRLGDGTLIDSMVHDGLTSTFDERHMVEQASFVSRELGISREEQDRWALRSHERAVEAIDEGRFADDSSPSATSRWTRGRGGYLAREARVAQAGVRSGGDDDRGQRARRQRRRGRGCGDERGVREEAGAFGAGDDRVPGVRRRRLRVPRAHAGEGGSDRAPESGQDDRRRGAGRAERGVLVGRPELGQDARRRGGEGERERGAVALGHPIGASGARIVGTLVHELRRNGGGLGLAAICSGGGQGDALLIEV